MGAGPEDTNMIMNPFLKLAFLAAVAVGLCGAPFAARGEAPAAGKPNIILVLTDDQGYGDLACHGHPYVKTPNLDRLYTQSTRLTDYHVSPTCAPTRAALMTGRAPFKNGITHTILERERMALKATTIAEVLKSAGYATGIFGKWHLGDEDPYQPGARGFDEVFIHGAGGIGQAYPGSCADAPGNKYFDPDIRHNGTFVKTRGYCTDIFFRQALGWIKSNRKKPFFAYISTNAPHSPYVCPEKYQKLYEEKVNYKPRAAFYGMITNIDENVGLLMRKLDEWDLAANTLLVFMTDNGSAAGDFNAGMRGKKASLHEGGSRVPAFFRLPGRIKAGRDIDVLTRHIDIFPTFAEMAGASYDVEVDGRSLLPLLTGARPDWPARYTFFHLGRWGKEGVEGWRNIKTCDPDEAQHQLFAVRDETWRLVNGDQLYNIRDDPGEKRNLIQQHPEVAKKMLNAYDKWWNKVRPFMVNEDVPLAKQHPYHAAYRKQREKTGIPEWSPPKL